MMRGYPVVAAFLALLLTAAGAVDAKGRTRKAGKPGPQARHAAVVKSMRAARTLHVRVLNHLDKAETEYWFRKPNLYQVRYADGRRIWNDGRELITLDADGKRAVAAAPETFPEEVRLMDFEPFFGEEPYGEWRGATTETLGGKKRRVYWLKTTESAITYGRAFLDPTTLLPIGHHTMEYNDVVRYEYYPFVRLNEAMPDALFRPPQ